MGLREGCLISPFHFLLVAIGLSMILKAGKREGYVIAIWEPNNFNLLIVISCR